MSDEQLLQGPIHSVHVDLGATFAPFGGWEMPVSYAGTVAEHTAVREAVGLFDVSHLGKALVAGAGAADFVNATLTADLGKIDPGQAQYTLCCTETGGVVDDLIAYYVADDEVFLVPNAANTADVVARLQAAAPEGIEITDQHRYYAVFAVQGPKAGEVLAALDLRGDIAIADIDYMGFADMDWHGVPVRVCRSGYTGERGFELLPRWADAEALFRALIDAVRAAGGEVAGLGARDTLRTEAGYPLHGHELSLDISPLQARCGWAIGWAKPQFWGRDALTAEKAAGPARRMWGIKALDRGVLRQGQTVSKDGASIGETTSGTFSPTLKVGIALALLDTASGVAAGDEISVDVRGRSLRCEVVTPPFVPVHTR
ncbi:glycine cleavage system aminomethyltransferase GcvT [Rhodococcus hoagii]|nr:glycine cleavage system aminomethyltransferase GcvT [Prescottella equi]NKR68153.1 glycine cleavage system aminomethyltransferase GcvT [Prescottella equi]NKR72772.1 glycine cleavage system aminomethyltransferase GcvT [Prescottella equi]NKS15726.1 glycine cleavage system aminomethyltransferase GcvT [Prescottella equi]NKT05265.1 glycine cleavage system aminomethyltransferase GcvT [Prescottella equi]